MEEEFVPEKAGWSAAHGRAADERAIEPLISFLRGNDRELRRTAVIALGQYDDARTVEVLSEAAARDWDVEVRRGAVESLGRVGGPAVVPLLINALADRAAAVQHTAVSALQRVGPPSVPSLVAALGCRGVTAPGVTARCGMASALGRIADERAIGPLIVALRAPEYEVAVRRAAATALGEIASRRPAPELRNALPILRRMGDPADGLYHRVMRQIEAATAGVQHLPLPAARPIPAGDDLPLPAQPPPPSPDGLPIPAASPEGAEAGVAPAGGRGLGVGRLLQRFLRPRRTKVSEP